MGEHWIGVSIPCSPTHAAQPGPLPPAGMDGCASPHIAARAAQLQAHSMHPRMYALRKSASDLPPWLDVARWAHSSPLLLRLYGQHFHADASTVPDAPLQSQFGCVMVIVSHRPTPRLREGSAGPSGVDYIPMGGGVQPKLHCVYFISDGQGVSAGHWYEPVRACTSLYEHIRACTSMRWGQRWGYGVPR